MSDPTKPPPLRCFRCGGPRIQGTRVAGGRRFACQQALGPCGFWWERTDGARLFQRTRMLADGREHPLLSPQAISRAGGRVLEVVTPQEPPGT